MKFIPLLIGAAFILSASARATLKPVTITGNMIHASATSPKVLKFNFLNPFEKIAPSAKIDAEGSLLVKENMLFTQNMTVQYNDTFINLYVSPGDSLHLTIDAALLDKPDFEWLTITGDDALISTQLNKCHDYLSTLPYKKYNFSLSVPDMRTALKKDYERQVAALNSYAVKNQLDPLVIEFSKRDILFGISNWISDYVDAGGSENSKKEDRIRLFSDPVFDMYNPANFQSMMFPYHLDYYTSWIITSDSAFVSAKKDGRLEDAVKAGAAVLMKQPAGLCRDYMLFSFISGYTAKTPALLDELPEISNYFTDPVYFSYLKKASTLANTVVFPVTPISGISYLADNGHAATFPAGDLFASLARKYPGKVVYIDVYATWCSPCLEEFKFAPALHNAYRNQEVAFVNLCLQSDISNWKKQIQDKIVTGENYFLDADATKLFMSTYHLSGFPSYLLVNKSGRIVSTQAPRPSDAEGLKKVMGELLK